jgi:hypothetical protein
MVTYQSREQAHSLPRRRSQDLHFSVLKLAADEFRQGSTYHNSGLALFRDVERRFGVAHLEQVLVEMRRFGTDRCKG